MFWKFITPNVLRESQKENSGRSWKIRKENVKNNGVTDVVMDCDSNEYSSHSLENTVGQTNISEWVLVIRYRYGKKR